MKTKNTFITISYWCFFTLNASAQSSNWAWAKSTGGNDHDQVNSVSSDVLGNTYAVGDFESSIITFDAFTLTNIGGSLNPSDIFIVKYDATGNVLWAKSAGGNKSDKATSVTIDASGNILVAGWFYSDSITFGAIKLIKKGIFIVKYDSAGNVLWAKDVGGGFGGSGTTISITTDASQNIYLAGSFTEHSITFGSTTLNNATTLAFGNYHDLFLVKYATNGNVIWAKSAGGSHIDVAQSVTTDASGNIYVTGWFITPSITFGFITLNNGSNTNYGDIFLVKYDTNGNVLWAKSAGGSGNEGAYSVTTDASDNIYVTGTFYTSSFPFGSTTLTNAGGRDIFLVKYDTNGIVLWAKSAGGSGDDISSSVKTDLSGNIYVAGYFASPSITFGSNTLTKVAYSDIFLVKYATNSSILWAKSAGGNDLDYATSVTTDVSGNIYVAGYFESSAITFGSTTLNNNNTKDTADLFIAKIYPSLLITTANITCNGGSNGSATATPNYGNAPYTYLWSTSPIQTTATATNLFSGNYTVTVTDVNNTTSTTTVTITAGIQTSTSTTNIYCNGDNNGAINLTVTGGSGNFLYSWSNGVTTQDLSSLIAGSYTVTVVDTTCSDTAINPTTITQPTALTTSMSVTNASSCSASNGKITATVSGGTFTYAYLWSNGKTSATITGLGQGTYTLTVTDANACTYITIATVSCPNGLTPLYQHDNLTIYPNPTDGIFQLAVDQNIARQNYELGIYNVLGEKVFSEEVYSAQSTIQQLVNLTIDISNQPTGIYFVKIRIQNESYMQKLVIQK